MTLSVDVGTRRPGGLWESICVHFHNFATLPDRRVRSPDFTCLGRRWTLCLYPRGTYHSDPGMVAVYLYKRSPNDANDDTEVEFALSLKDSNFKDVVCFKDLVCSEQDDTDDDIFADGDCDFAKRSKVKKALVEGTMTIEVRMRGRNSTSTNSAEGQFFIPGNPIGKNILNMFMDEASSDVVFEVEGERAPGASKRAKVSTVTFPAHRLILQQCAPALAEMGGKARNVPISGVKPEIFRHALYYAYGGAIANDEMKAHAKDIIVAADKFGMSNLKLEAEASYVRSTTISLDNVMDNLLYADAKNCALLKEAAIDFVAEHGAEVLKSVSLKDVPGGMFADLLTATTRNKERGGKAGDGAVELSTMRVSELREKLHEKGLDVDGSRETMIKMLEEHW